MTDRQPTCVCTLGAPCRAHEPDPDLQAAKAAAKKALEEWARTMNEELADAGVTITITVGGERL